MVVIDEKAKIPLILAIGAIPAIVMAVFWIATLSGRVGAAEQRTDRIVDKIHTMESREDKVLDALADIRERLGRIEGRLNKL